METGKTIRPFCTHEGSGLEAAWQISKSFVRAQKWKKVWQSGEALWDSAGIFWKRGLQRVCREEEIK